MLRFLTAGESHGQGLVVILEGLPAGPTSQVRLGDPWAAVKIGAGRTDRTVVRALLQRSFRRRPAQLAGFVSVLATLVVILLHQSGGPLDQTQMPASFNALLSGHLSAVYPPTTDMTSPPGFVILAAPILALFGGDPSARIPQLAMGVASAGFLALAAGRLGRRLRPGTRGVGTLVVTAAVVLGAPSLFALYGAYHPEDLVATGFVLLALADTGSGHDRRAGLELAAALLCRQWALLVVAPVLLASGPGWRRVGGTAGAACVAVLAPFAALEPAGLRQALEAKAISISPYTLWAYLPLPQPLAFMAARLGPLVCCIPAAAMLRRAWGRSPPEPTQLVAAAAFFLSLRSMLDVAVWPYYATPLFVLLVLLVWCDRARARRTRTLVAALALEALLLWEPYYYRAGARLSFLVAVALLAAVVGASMCAWKTALRPHRIVASEDQVPFEPHSVLVPVRPLRRVEQLDG